MSLKLPKLDNSMAVVVITVTRRDPKTGEEITEEWEGVPSTDFQRFWQAAVIKSDGSGDSVLDKVTKLNTAVYPGGVASAIYDQTQIQTMMNALSAISTALQQ